MMVLKYKLILLFLPLFILSSCTEKKADDLKEQEETAAESSPGELSLSTAQMQSVGIVIGKIERKNLNSVVKANGQLAVPPQNKADVSVLSGGLIRKINVLEGQRVRQGQVLAMIENQELLKIQQDYLTVKNNFSYIQAEYKRQQQLAAAGAGTGKFLQAATANYHAELSKINAYESQLRQLGIPAASIAKGNMISQFPLVAPISGTVGQISANMGAFVQPGTSIMEVVDNSKIHCDLIVFEKDLMKVKVGQQVDFQLTNQENQQIRGKINGINKSFEKESKGVIVHAVIENTANLNLIPGMYVTALIGIGTQLSTAVPVDAVIRSEGKEYIFVVDKKTGDQVSFQQTEVKTGVSELGYIEISSLEKWGDDIEIAKKGAFYLQSKASGGAEEE